MPISPERLEKIRKIISDYPTTPGVYLMKNTLDKIIYVGKAKSLKARLRSYITGVDNHSAKTISLVSNIEKIEFILTQTEVEAYLLEASLIKKHRPKYNILLKDDKSYPYIKFSAGDEFPRLYLVRKVKKDGGLYFGPFTSGLQVWETIKFLNRTFQIRDCADTYFRNRTRPCLTHQIGNCTAPCVAMITKEQYQQQISGALLFLKGKGKQVLKIVKERMQQEAADLHFENAAKLRDSLEALKAILQKQAVINNTTEKDQDIVGFEGDERGTTIEVLHVRQGKLLGSQPHFISLLNPHSEEENPQDWLASFINQYYVENFVPDEIVLPMDLGGDIHKLLAQVLKERAGHEVAVRMGTSSEAHQLLELANRNAAEHFRNYVTRDERKKKGLEEIKEKLGLAGLPVRIECYDISNFQGAESVASQVVFEDGVPSKDHYRRYKIKTVTGANDFAMMKEVISRRLAHSEEDEPQLIVVDGGKGQLAIAVEVLKEMQKEHIPVVGLAKARTKGSFTDAEVTGTEERVFIPGRQNPVIFAKNSDALHILVGIRDEAHRFAITYHRKLRENRGLESELDAVTGLGEKRKRTLLKKYSSMEQLKTASVEEISELSGFNRVLAERILLQLNEVDDIPIQIDETSVSK